MSSLARVSRINVLTAIRDHDLQGPVPFREALGFDVPSTEVLVERGRRYDARAVLSYAHGKATGEALTPEQVTFDSLKVLVDHGFSVVTSTEAARPKARARATKSTRPSTRTPAAPARPEPEVRLCPRCFTQLPVAGSCDFCD